jgi:hypothetical protein
MLRPLLTPIPDITHDDRESELVAPPGVMERRCRPSETDIIWTRKKERKKECKKERMKERMKEGGDGEHGVMESMV